MGFEPLPVHQCFFLLLSFPILEIFKLAYLNNNSPNLDLNSYCRLASLPIVASEPPSHFCCFARVDFFSWGGSLPLKKSLRLLDPSINLQEQLNQYS